MTPRGTAPVGGATGQDRTPAAAPRLDASMSLLNDLMDVRVDEEYAEAAARRAATGARPRRRAWVSGLVLVAAGLLLAAAAVQWQGSKDRVEAERASLAERIRAETARLDDLEAEGTALQAEVALLRDAQLRSALSAEQRERLSDLGVATGADAVVGPGLRVVVDDAEPAAGGEVSDDGRVLDTDLQQLVNGLWAAGAEAVSVDGQRLTASTPVRAANEAILVGYRPVDPPYEVLAVGDTRTMEARLAAGPAGDWFDTVSRLYGIGYDVSSSERLELPAAIAVAAPRYARVIEEDAP